MVVKSKPLFGGIDIIRFFAAVMVALFHYLFWVWAYPSGISGSAARVGPPTLIGNSFSWGWIGVEIFFVISGLVIAGSAENSSPRNFAIARFVRLVPAVLICAPITAFFLLASKVTSVASALFLTMKSIFFVPFAPWIDSVYWTLGVEIAFYGLVWLLLVLQRSRWIEPMALVIGAASSIFWSAYFMLDLKALAENRLLDLLLLHHGCFFAIGVLMNAARKHGITGVRIFFIGLFTAAGLMQIVNASDVISLKVGFETFAAIPIVVYLIGTAVIWFSLWADFTWVGWRKIGVATYPFYLIHDAAGCALLGMLVRSGLPYIGSVSIVFVMTIAFSCAVAWRVEKPIRDWLKRLVKTPVLVS